MPLIPFGLKRRIEGEYARRIGRIFMLINKAVAGLSYEDAAKKILQMLETPDFKAMVDYAVLNMVTMVKSDNEKTWRQAAAKGSYGRILSAGLKDNMSQKGMASAVRQILMDNAYLIRSVPIDVAKRMTDRIYQDYLEGKRGAVITRYVKSEALMLTMKRAKLIARTEASKANAAMTEVRSRDMGADWYIWRSSKDERVRSSHRFMEGVFVPWDYSPNPEALSGEKDRFGRYHAGCCPNCRCYAEPLIDESQVAVKVRVFRNGGITVMGRNQFLRMIGKRQVVA